MALLEVRDLSVDFTTGAGQVQAVKKVSFDLNKGETLCLVGESGSGKSVTAMSVLQLLPYPKASHPSGAIRFDGEQVVDAPEATLQALRGNRVAVIFQEPLTALNPLHTIERQISESLFLHTKLDGTAVKARVLELLHLVGIPDPESRLKDYPHQLSGGQRQRVMIAMALACEPELLIADEPTTALDVTVQAQILDLLKDLTNKLGLALLFITHDFGVVRKMADRIAVMKDGEIVETGTADAVLANPQHPYSQLLINAEPSGGPAPIAADAATILQANDLKVWFPVKRGVMRRIVGHIKAVDGVSFTLRKGETLGVVGESGSGKSTLANAILRLVSSTGQVSFEGQDLLSLGKQDMQALRRDIQVVFQDPFGSLSPRLSIAEIVSEALAVHEPGLGDEEILARVIAALKEVGLGEDALWRWPHEFSGGQRQRIAIARALIVKPKLLILDEPTSALDRSVQAQVIDLLRDLQQKYGLAYIFISHDLAVVRALAHEVLVMKDGNMVEEGPCETVLQNPSAAYTRDLLAAALS